MFQFSAGRKWKNKLKLGRLDRELTGVEVGNEIDGVLHRFDRYEEKAVEIDHVADGIENGNALELEVANVDGIVIVREIETVIVIGQQEKSATELMCALGLDPGLLYFHPSLSTMKRTSLKSQYQVWSRFNLALKFQKINNPVKISC